MIINKAILQVAVDVYIVLQAWGNLIPCSWVQFTKFGCCRLFLDNKQSTVLSNNIHMIGVSCMIPMEVPARPLWWTYYLGNYSQETYLGRIRRANAYERNLRGWMIDWVGWGRWGWFIRHCWCATVRWCLHRFKMLWGLIITFGLAQSEVTGPHTHTLARLLTHSLYSLPSTDTPQFRGGNPYIFGENLYQSVSFISMHRCIVKTFTRFISRCSLQKIATLCNII